MTTKQFSALLGFLFVAVWIAENVGYALLCLVGAAAFGAIAAVVEGELDLGEVQSRLQRDGGGLRGDRSAPGPAPRPMRGPRVR